MKKIVVISLIVIAVLIIGGVLFLFMMPGPDLSQFEHLKEPQISTEANQKVIVVEVKGNLNEVGSKAFGLLFKRRKYNFP